MVQKYQSPVRVYKFPFELVMLAYERRFPKCPQMPIVLDCQITNDETSANGAIKRTGRRCKLAVEAPYLFKKLIGLDVVYFVQTNHLDWETRSLNIEATNETYSSRIEIFERCRYYAHPENPDWTCFDQTATLDIKNFFGFEHSMEKMGMKQYTQMTLKGKEIIEYFIEELRSEGITSAPVWTPPIETTPTLAISADSAGGTTSDTETLNRSHQHSCDVENCITEERPPTKASTEAAGRTDGASPAVSLGASPKRRMSSEIVVAGSRKPSISEFEEMLDTDYIHAKLGDLEPLQMSKLLELRNVIKEQLSVGGKIPNYPTLLRFLRARDFNVDKAAGQLQDTMRWRIENGIDSLLQGYQQPAVLRAHFPGGWHAADLDGRPLYILRLGHMDVKGLLKALGEEGLLQLALHICEEGLRLLDEAADRLQRPVMSWSLLIDLDGLSMRHLWRPGVKALLRIIETVERNYPETLGRVFVVRAPRVFPIAWTIVSAFIDEHTRTKFLFYGGPDCLHMKDGLELYIDSSVIPDFLGGPCKSLIHEGCLVPKSLYLSTIDEHQPSNGGENTNSNYARPSSSGPKVSQPHNSSLYKSADLEPGQLYELALRNDDPKSVLTWDFDVVTGNLQFTVFRCTSAAGDSSSSRKDESGSSGSGNSGGSILKSSIIADPSTSLLTNIGIGMHIEKAEPTLMCQSKESVQGSHVMTTTGLYILQWSCPGDSDQPAQLMHFHEILSSHNYKGSMSSLRSGISVLSLNTSMPSR